MLARRSVLRSASLAVLAAPLLAACGSDGPAGRVTRARSGLVSSSVARAPVDRTALPGAVRSAWTLGAGLWESLAGQGGNLALSPYSVLAALGMTLNGAAGATREEMLGVLATGSEHELNAGLNALTKEVEALAGRKVTLDAANQLFGQDGVPWEQDFLDVLAREYGAGLRTVDFTRSAEAARAAVNTWTAGRTHDRIPEILPPESVHALTRLVLVNALYFRAPWQERFERPLTQPGPFHLADGSVVEVPVMRGMMTATGYAAGDGWTSVRIPYEGGTTAMTVVLPDPGRDVDVAGLPAVVAAARPAAVELAMPRWTFRTAVSLGDVLAGLGMPSAFDEARADLTRMTDSDEHLVIDEVHHQVFVAVDEEGTEAAAATAVSVVAVSAPVAEHQVVLDRPFVFVIHDVEHGTPLFVGRVDDPS